MTLRLTIGSALLGATLAFSAQGGAEPRSPKAPAAEVDAARAKFEAGADAYQAGRYQEAIEAFLAADAIAPRAALSFNVARAYDKLGDEARALDYYRQYLERDPNGATAGETRERISALEAALAARNPKPEAAPAPAHAAPVTAHSSGAEPELAPQVASPAAAVVRSEPQRFGHWRWVVLGAGGAALATSFGFELARRSAEDDAEAAPHADFQGYYDSMERRKVTARVFAGIGGALLVAGGVLVYLDHRAQDSVALSCGPSLCEGHWVRRF